MIGFWAGFLQEVNRIEDRKERERLLMQEIGAKRQEQLITLVGKAAKRNAAGADNTQALAVLRRRAGDAEGADEWIAAVAKTGKAPEILKKIQEEEAKSEGHELHIAGDALVNGVTPFYNPDTNRPDVSISLDQIINTRTEEFANNDKYFKYLGQTVEAASGNNEGAVDYNPQVFAAGNNKSRKEAEEYFDKRLIESFNVSDNNTRAEDAQWVADVQALQGDNVAAKVMARNRLMYTPEGVDIYNEMLTSDVPSYRVIGSVGGNYDVLGQAKDIVDNWPTYTPEQQDQYLTQYKFIQPIVRPDGGVEPLADVPR